MMQIINSKSKEFVEFFEKKLIFLKPAGRNLGVYPEIGRLFCIFSITGTFSARWEA